MRDLPNQQPARAQAPGLQQAHAAQGCRLQTGGETRDTVACRGISRTADYAQQSSQRVFWQGFSTDQRVTFRADFNMPRQEPHRSFLRYNEESCVRARFRHANYAVTGS